MARKKMMSKHSNISPSVGKPLKCQNLLKDHSNETCRFSDADIEVIAKFFPESAEFRPYDPNACSDSISDEWVCFPATPFLLGFCYPFPDLTEELFTCTGISFIQAMPMVWRVLSVIEEALASHPLEFSVSELSYLYTLVTHGSSRFVLKSKLGKAHPVLKTKRNDQKWKGQFFFVKRSTIPGGKQLPKKWVSKVKDFGDLSSEPGTQDRALAFLSLSQEERTFHQKIPNSEETVASSSNMSNASKSTTKSSTKFVLDDIDSQFAKKKVVKKETSSVPPVPKPATRSKSVANKRKRSIDPKEELGTVKRNMMSSLTDGISFIEEFYEKNVSDLEEELSTLRSSLAAKDEELGAAVKGKKIAEDSLEKSIKANDKKWRKEVEKAVREAKVCASKAVLESRVKIVKEALDPDFDKTSWDLDHWEQLLKEMVDEDEEDIGTAERLVETVVKGKGKLVDEAEVLGADQGVDGKTEVGEKGDDDQGNAP